MSNDLNDCFIRFCNLRGRILKGESIEDIEFMYPTTLVPLLPHIESGAKISNAVKGYVSSITKSAKSNPRFILEKIESGQTSPFKMDLMIDSLSTEHDKSTLQYFFTELITNIYEHSDCKRAYAMAQTYRKTNKFTEFCLYDDGITIPASLKNFNDDFRFIEDCQLINLALNGVSTKTKDGSRGFGMNTSAQVIVDGYKGELFISSADGSIHIKSGDKDPILYIHGDSSYYRTKGTLIGMRIPYKDVKITYHPFLESKRSFTGTEASKI